MENRYDNITITTNKEEYSLLLEDLPEAVVDYLDKFLEEGWTPENEPEWAKTFEYFENLYKGETIVRILGHTFFTDTIYENGGVT